MDPINFVAYLFLALIPDPLNLIAASLAQVIYWSPLVIWAYIALGKDFAQNHPFIVLGMFATGAAHITCLAWGHMALLAEAPLALGIAALAGYLATLSGLIPAFIRERNIAQGYS